MPIVENRHIQLERRGTPAPLPAERRGRGSRRGRGRRRRQRFDGRVAGGAGGEVPDRRCGAPRPEYGFAGGYNRALAQIEADYYLLLNSDVETPAGWLEPILGVLEREPDVAVVSPKLVSSSLRDSSTQGLPGALSTSWAILFAGGVSSSGSKPTRGSTTMPATFSGSAEQLFAAVPTCSAHWGASTTISSPTWRRSTSAGACSSRVTACGSCPGVRSTTSAAGR